MMIFRLHATAEYTEEFSEMIKLLVDNKFNVYKDNTGMWCIMFNSTDRLIQMSQLLEEELVINTDFMKLGEHPILEIYNYWRE